LAEGAEAKAFNSLAMFSLRSVFAGSSSLAGEVFLAPG
jgi:hypothetical protein